MRRGWRAAEGCARSAAPGAAPLRRVPSLRSVLLPLLLLLALLALLAAPARGNETDPYGGRDIPLADSLAVLDAEVNAALDAIAAGWPQSGRRDDALAFADAVYRRIGGLHWVDRLERWAMTSPRIERIAPTRGESLFAGTPWHVARGALLVDPSPLIEVAGVRIGTDKIGHFLSQGRKFYRRYRRTNDETLARRRSMLAESGIFGQLVTGIYSNADLVANYEGYRFYASLFEDGAVAGKPAIFRWRDGAPARQRPFTFADHVNPLWDEALNPNVYAPGFAPAVKRRLLGLCGDFARRPARYQVDYDALLARYRGAGLRPNRELMPSVFLPRHCPRSGPEGGAGARGLKNAARPA